jgi:hypothetical protein
VPNRKTSCRRFPGRGPLCLTIGSDR